MAKRTKRTGRKSNANVRLSEPLVPKLRDFLETLPKGVFRYDYLKEQVFSKYVGKETDPSEVRRQRAIDKWKATETRNEDTNLRLLFQPLTSEIVDGLTWGQFLRTCRRFITDVIGETPLWESKLEPLVFPSGFDNLYDWYDQDERTKPNGREFPAGFSGGATTSRSRLLGHPARKYLGKADITASARPFFELWFEECERWSHDFSRDDIREVEGNVLFTVPKNSEIDRCACKEPDLNMYLQRGYGSIIRRALKRVGIDLNDQSRNKRLAKEGSITGNLATLDLSSASDSISYELVNCLLPEIWFTNLDCVRSRVTTIDGEVHENEMFSSMGNGFTFELESLLFYAIARTVAYHEGIKGVISVYGDDIIVPTGIAHRLVSVLEFLGFQVNTQKSFIEGPFRESCGGHYFRGEDVTPFYVKGETERLVDAIHLCNQIRNWSSLDGQVTCDPIIEELWCELITHVPKRFWGGHDTNFKGQLVTRWVPDRPKKLVPAPRPGAIPEEGRYLLWLDQGRQRAEGLTESVISNSEPSSAYVEKRVSDGHFRELGAVFYHEVVEAVPEVLAP
nr:MAG: RNA replicase beta chain [Sanya fiers-like virus 26]